MRVLAILMLGLFIGAPAATADEPSAPTEPKVGWVSKPDINDIFKCFKIMHKGDQIQEGVVMMQCATAPDDHIANCTVTSNSQPDDERYGIIAVCATKYFRMRATGPDGKPVMGVSVNVPFRFAAGMTEEQIVKAIRKQQQ